MGGVQDRRLREERKRGRIVNIIISLGTQNKSHLFFHIFFFITVGVGKKLKGD